MTDLEHSQMVVKCEYRTNVFMDAMVAGARWRETQALAHSFSEPCSVGLTMFLARRCLKYLRYELLLKNGSGNFIGLMTCWFHCAQCLLLFCRFSNWNLNFFWLRSHGFLGGPMASPRGPVGAQVRRGWPLVSWDPGPMGTCCILRTFGLLGL